MNPMVSIIVPVYNAEKTLRRCVDSILNQEYEDFELLLVDDGSSDASREICDGYAAADRRVAVIHKENSGVSDARNKGIDMAEGKYLQFVDSDDWIARDATKRFVRAAARDEADMVIADFYRTVGDRISHKGDIEEEGALSLEEFAACMMENPADFYYGVLWNKLYRKDLVEAHGLRMNGEISWCEDFMFNLEYMRHVNVISVLRAPVYYYVKTKGSLVTQGMSIPRTVRMKLMVFEYYDNFYRHVFDETVYEKNRLQVYRFLVDAAGDGIVPPFFFPGSKKLGSEKSEAFQDAVTGEGIQRELYRKRKLLDRYLEMPALKYALPLDAVGLLLYFRQTRTVCTRKELADFLNLSPRKISAALQRLSGKGLIRVEEQKGRSHPLRIEILPEAQPLLQDVESALRDLDEGRFLGISEEDLLQYQHTEEKIKGNIQKALLG